MGNKIFNWIKKYEYYLIGAIVLISISITIGSFYYKFNHLNKNEFKQEMILIDSFLPDLYDVYKMKITEFKTLIDEFENNKDTENFNKEREYLKLKFMYNDISKIKSQYEAYYNFNVVINEDNSNLPTRLYLPSFNDFFKLSLDQIISKI